MNDTLSVSIVGAGAMGSGIAQIAAAHGHSVSLFDARPAAADAAITAIIGMYSKLAAKGKMSTEDAKVASVRLRPAATLADLAHSSLVIEAIVEDLTAKRALFASLDAIVSPDCLLATNTSSLSIAAMATALRRPERLVGMHFFNPAPLMDLVEVVAGVATDPQCRDRIEAIAQAWGKTTVRTRATPGFIVNRVARPFYTEGLRLVAELAATPATLDALLRDAAGFRMGPCELTDLIGQDVNFAVTSSLHQSFFADPRFQPSLVQQELVEAGWLGRKSGRGFYSYASDAPAPAPDVEPTHAAPDRIALTGHEASVATLAARLESAGVAVARPPHLHLPTDVVLHISDGRTAAQLEMNHDRPRPQATVVVDLCLDYTSAKRLAVAVSPHCSAASRAAAIGALQASGFAVSVVADLPGLIVLRTVAMLINEANDAVHFGVASSADVDLALRKGVNYPLGPFAWADALGPAFIARVLTHIAHFYGEPRYRVSPRLRVHL